MKKIIVILFYILFHSFSLFSQGVKIITLDDAIKIAQIASLDYKIATNVAKSGYWRHKAFKASLLPKMSLSGMLPEYYHSINRITLPNGQYDFINQNVATSSVGLSISQNVGFLGGIVSISSSLSRIDNFGRIDQSIYSSIPFSFDYFQESIFYNAYKWQKKLDPLFVEETKRDYIERLEEISVNIVSLYFRYLLAEEQHKLSEQNFRNITDLLKITNARFEIGTVQLNDVLQVKVSVLNAKKALSASEISLESAKQEIYNFLNFDTSANISAVLPEQLKHFDVDPKIVFANAKDNSKSFLQFKRRRIEAEQEVARVKSQTGPEINIRTNFGFSQRGSSVSQAYNKLLNSQTVVVGIAIPLVDWGVNRSNRRQAEANLELENNTITQETLSIEQGAFLVAMRWNKIDDEMEISRQVKDLAQQRYGIAIQKYSAGSLTFIDFNNAQIDKDKATLEYIEALRIYWDLYYVLRRMTLFNFEENRKIDSRDIIFD